MLSSLSTKLSSSIKRLSPKTLLSNYIASKLSSLFLNVNPQQIESNLVSDEIKKICLKHVSLKPSVVTLPGGSDGVGTKMMVWGTIDMIEFSWTWGDSSTLITNVELMMDGVAVVVTPVNNENDANRIEGDAKSDSKEEEEEEEVAGEDATRAAKNKEENEDWKSKYFQQIVDHLTLSLSNVSIDVYLPSSSSSSSSRKEDDNGGEHSVVSLRGKDLKIVSFGRQHQPHHIHNHKPTSSTQDSSSKGVSSTVPLSQELILRSISCFVVSLPKSSPSAQTQPQQKYEKKGVTIITTIKDKNEEVEEVEDVEEWFDPQGEEEDNCVDTDGGANNNNSNHNYYGWQQEVTKSIQNHLSSPKLSSVSSSSSCKVNTLLAPFDYKTQIKRVSGQRFVDGILTGLEVSGDSSASIEMCMGIAQAKTLQALMSLVTSPQSSSTYSSPTTSAGVETKENIHQNMGEEKIQESREEKSSSSVCSNKSNDDDDADDRNSDFSVFILPFQSISLTLSPSSHEPAVTTLSIRGITFTYRTDGNVFTIHGTGAITSTPMPLLCNKNNSTTMLLEDNTIVWEIDMIRSRVSLSPIVESKEKQDEKVMKINCPLYAVQNVMSGLKELSKEIPSTVSPSSRPSSSSVATPWSMSVDGKILFHLEVEEEEEEEEKEDCVSPLTWMDIEIDQFSFKPTVSTFDVMNESFSTTNLLSTNALLEHEISWKQIKITSSSSSLLSSSPGKTTPSSSFAMQIPESTFTTKDGLRIPKKEENSSNKLDGDISIVMTSIDTLKEIQSFFNLYQNAVSFSDNCEDNDGSDIDGDVNGTNTITSPSMSLPPISIQYIQINLMREPKLGGSSGTVSLRAFSTLYDECDDLFFPSWKCDTLDVHGFSDNVDNVAKREDGKGGGNVLSVKNIQVSLPCLLEVKGQQHQGRKQQYGSGSMIAEMKIGEIITCSIPDVGYIASPISNAILRLSQDGTCVASDFNNEMMTVSIKCEGINFVTVALPTSARAVNSNCGFSVASPTENMEKDNTIADLAMTAERKHEKSSNVSMASSSLASVLSFQLPCSIELNLDSIRVKTKQQQEYQDEEKNDNDDRSNANKQPTIKDLIICHQMYAKLKPSPSIEVNEIILPCSGIVKIGEISKFEVPGVCQLLSPMQNSELQFEKGAMQVKCDTIEVLKLDNDMVGAEEKERKTLVGSDFDLPSPVSATVREVVVKTKIDEDFIKCSNIQVDIKPATTKAAGGEGGGKLPFLGMIKVGEISAFSVPGSGRLISPMKSIAIRLEPNSIGIRCMAIEVLKSSNPHTMNEAADEGKIEDIFSSFPQLPCPIRILSPSIVVQQVIRNETVDFLGCVNIDVTAWPDADASLPSGVLKIGEISTFNIPGSGRLSYPVYNSSIKLKNGILQVECTDIRVIKLDANQESSGAQLPLPINLTIAKLTVDKCSRDGNVTKWVCCSQISAKMKPAKKKGGLPTGTINVGEVSEFVDDDNGRLLAPMKDSIIRLEENSVHVECMDIKVIKFDKDTKNDCESSAAEISDIWLPCSIYTSLANLELKQQGKDGSVDDWISCSSTEANLQPNPEGKLFRGKVQVGEVSTFNVPSSGYLSAPLCSSTIEFEDNVVKIECKSISVVKTNQSDNDGPLNRNEIFDITEAKIWLPCQVQMNVESLNITSCDQFGIAQNLLSCLHINAAVKPGTRGHLPSVVLNIGEVSKLSIAGTGYLSAPIKNPVVRFESNCVQVVCPTVRTVAVEQPGANTTTASGPPSLSLPCPVRISVAELLVQHTADSKEEDFIKCSFIDLDLKPIKDKVLPVGTLSVGEVSKLNVSGVFCLSSPLQNTILRCDGREFLVEITSIDVVVFEEAIDGDENVDENISPASSTTTKLPFPIRLTINNFTARKLYDRDLVPLDWVCCGGVDANLRPAQGGNIPLGTVKIEEVSKLNFPTFGCLSAPLRDSLLRLEPDSIKIECKVIEAMKFRAPRSTHKSQGSSDENDWNDSLKLPCRVITVIEGIVLKAFDASGSSLEDILCCKGINVDLIPSSGGLPSGRLTIGEISKFVMEGSGYISAPITNSVVELENDVISIECANIEALTYETPSEQTVEASTSIDFSLPCPIRIVIRNLAINADEMKCCSTDIRIMPLKDADMAHYQGYNGCASAHGSQIAIHRIGSFELRNMLKVEDLTAKAVVQHNQLDVLYGAILSAKRVILRADFSSVDWSTALLGKKDGAEPTVLKLPFASVTEIMGVLEYRGKVLSVSASTLKLDAFVGDEHTTSENITKHYIGVVKGRAAAILGNVELLGSNLTDMGAMQAGRAVLMAGTSTSAAMGSVVGLGIKDALDGALDAGKSSRGASSEEKYRFGDLGRGIAASVKSAAKSGASMRNDDKYVLGDVTAGSLAATGSYARNNSERLSKAGGASAGMVIGTAVAGPLGLVAGSFLGGKIAGDATKKLSKSERNNVNVGSRKTDQTSQIAAAQSSNFPGASKEAQSAGTNSAHSNHPPRPVTSSYPGIRHHSLGTDQRGSAPARGSVSSYSQTSGQSSSDYPFGILSAGGNASGRATGSAYQNQSAASDGLSPPKRALQPQYTTRDQIHGATAMPQHNLANQRHPSAVHAGAGSQSHLNPYTSNQSNRTSAVYRSDPLSNQPGNASNLQQTSTAYLSAPQNQRQQGSIAHPPATSAQSHQRSLAYPAAASRQGRQMVQQPQRRNMPQQQQQLQQPQQQQGYRFGDITRSIVASGKKKSGRDEKDGYKFGDFTRGLFG